VIVLVVVVVVVVVVVKCCESVSVDATLACDKLLLLALL
jgi:hypothetical protein